MNIHALVCVFGVNPNVLGAPEKPARNKEYGVKVIDDKGVEIQIDPKPCIDAREGIGKPSKPDRPASRKIQEAETKIVEMIGDLADFLQDRRFAVYPLRTPRVEIGDQSPLKFG